MDSQVTHVFFDTIFFQVAVASMDLQGIIADTGAELSCYLFGHS